ncbi:MAG TPA: ATP-binding protein [Tepidisphaeraceae bacterium]|jgi:signal transduction histidine kinase|nr:ATP-binding protein [Tepidisphaeraceae bacterium]
MKSIQNQLTVRLLVVALLLTLGAGSFVYTYARLRFTHEFDEELGTKAKALSSMMLRQPDGRLEFDFSPLAMPEFGRHSYFEIWRDDGRVVSRSPSLKGADLVAGAPASMGLFDFALPDGRAGRAVAIRFIPRPDEADGPPPHGTPNPSSHTLTLLCAQSHRDLDRVLGVLLTSLVLTATLVCVVVAIAVMLTVKRSMIPLRRLIAEVDGIGATSLGHRFAADDLPTELRPIAQRLNGLLDRLEEAFGRERRFTADVAHELRTPIAELRSTVEVAMKWPGQSDESQNFRDILEIATQMETLVNALLAIARCESGIQPVRLGSVDLSESLHDVWRLYERTADARGLSMTWDVAPGVLVKSDRSLLLPLLANLLDNAATYTPINGRMACSLRTAGAEAELSISNTNQTLAPEDIRHLFEPFWRKDPARSGGTHCGLGLSLVAAYAVAIGASVRASLDGRQIFTVVTTFPPAIGESDSAVLAPAASQPSKDHAARGG